MRFFFIYKALAHPETNGYVQPLSLEERLLHVREAEKRLGATIPWLCDSMDNAAKHALGDAPNSEFIIDAKGRIAVRRVWSKPKELREDLERLVGPVEHPTSAEETGVRRFSRAVPRSKEIKPLDVPRGMVPLVVQASSSEDPFYVKLRAEAERSVTTEGKGKVYLGFRLDPLYPIHFNNLAGVFEFEIKAPRGWKITPGRGKGPKIEAETDAAPREFLVEVERSGGAKTAEWTVIVRYFGCHDDEGWCKPLTHEYRVALAADADGGRVIARGRPGGPGNRLGAMGRPRLGPPPFRARGGGERIMGIVDSIDRSRRQFVVRQMGGGKATYRWTPKTFVVRRGEGRTTIDKLRVGDRVRMEVEKKGQDDGAKEPTTIIRMMIGSPGDGPPRKRR